MDADYADRVDHYPAGVAWRTLYRPQLEDKVEARKREAAVRGEAAYAINLEPPSAMFVDKLAIKVVGQTSPLDPLDNKVVTVAQAELNDIARWQMNELLRHGVPFQAFARSGGGYHDFQNKKIKRDLKFEDIILHDAIDLYRGGYGASGVEKLRKLIREYRDRVAFNFEQLRGNPELLMVGKPPSTGTGWDHPWDTRENMAKNFSSGVAHFEQVVKMFYDQLVAAVDAWPQQGSVIHLPSGDRSFKGIWGGSRSDADVVDWSVSPPLAFEYDGKVHNYASGPWQLVRIEAATRQVGNDPSSVFFCPGTTPTSWTMEMWAKYSSEYHLMPDDLEGFARVMTTPPATIRGDDPLEMVLVSADFGFNEISSRVDDLTLVVVKPGITLGADNIAMRDIFLESRKGLISLLESGEPFTMVQYLATAGEPVAEWARQAGVKPGEMEIYQVGDDLQILIQRRHLAGLFAALGPWLKVKGMTHDANRKQHTVFLLGHYVCWHEDTREITVFMEPRLVKTVSSAQAVGNHKLPDVIEAGVWYPLEPSDEAKEAVRVTFEAHKDHLFYHGLPEGWFELATETGNLWEAKLALAQVGFSEYFKDLLGDYTAEQRAAVAEALEANRASGAASDPAPELVTTLSGTAAPAGVPSEAMVIYGFPTTGKTEAAQALQERGYACWDTDDMLAKVTSEAGIPADQIWEAEGRLWREQHEDEVLVAVKSYIQSYKGDVVFTNLRSVGNIKRGFIRTDPDVVRALMAQRGSDPAKHDVESWCADAAAEAAIRGDKVLGEGEFILAEIDDLFPDRASGVQVYAGQDAVRVVMEDGLVAKIFSPDANGWVSIKYSPQSIEQRAAHWNTDVLLEESDDLARIASAAVEIPISRMRSLLGRHQDLQLRYAVETKGALRYVCSNPDGEIIVFKKANDGSGDSVALYPSEDRWDTTVGFMGAVSRVTDPDMQTLAILQETIYPNLAGLWVVHPVPAASVAPETEEEQAASE